MKLVSVNVAAPLVASIHGRQVETGILVTIAEFVRLYRVKRAARERINRILSLSALLQNWKDRLTGRTPVREE